MQQAQNNQDFLFDHTHKSFAEVGGISRKKSKKKSTGTIERKKSEFRNSLIFHLWVVYV